MFARELSTPALTADIDVLERNLERVAELCRRQGAGLRPQTKPHKTVGGFAPPISAPCSGPDRGQSRRSGGFHRRARPCNHRCRLQDVILERARPRAQIRLRLCGGIARYVHPQGERRAWLFGHHTIPAPVSRWRSLDDHYLRTVRAFQSPTGNYSHPAVSPNSE